MRKIGKPEVLTPDMERQHRKDSFIEQLMKSKTIGMACKESGIAPSTVQNWRKQDDFFNDAVQDALDIVTSEAEMQLWSVFTDPDARPNDKIQAARFILTANNTSYQKRQEKQVEYVYLGNGSPMPKRAEPARLSSSEAGNMERPHDGS